MSRNVTQNYLITIMAMQILAGAFNAIAYKTQNKQMVYEGVFYKEFFHPFMQATTMFFGQFLSLIVFFIYKAKNPQKFIKRRLRAEKAGKSMNLNKLLIAIPAFADFITATLHYTALNFIPGSVYQMMRGSTVITTMLFSIFFLKKKLKKHQIIGSFVVLSGILLVAFSNLSFAMDLDYYVNTDMQIVGYILVLGLAFSNAFIFVFEETLLDKFYLQPIQLVGYEGLFGLIIEMIFLPIVSNIPCYFGIQACVFTRQSMPFIQVPYTYFSQIFQSNILIVFCLIGIFSISISNIAGVNVTKHISALTRSIGDVSRVIIIWSVGSIVTIYLGSEYPNYRWQIVTFKSVSVQFLGFTILITGNMIYNAFIYIPYIHKRKKQPSLDKDQQKMQELEQIDQFKTDKPVYEDDLSIIL